jgi:lipopolysaccharide transport system permease protein
MISSIIRNRHLIKVSIEREVVGRYRGSYLGILWSLVIPLFLLAVYTFVFSVAFKMRWGTGLDESRVNFAIVLFAGLIVHSTFSEAIVRAPSTIVGNVNLVKKVVFPLEILPLVTLGAALFHLAVSVMVLLLGVLVAGDGLSWTALLLPVVLLPFVVLTAGFSWMLASLGVYLRDVGQFVNLITSVLLFMTPVFYPLSSIPEKYQGWMMLNPLTFIIEETRAVVVWGALPDWGGLALYSCISIAVAWLGFYWFQKTRKGFADVL